MSSASCLSAVAAQAARRFVDRRCLVFGERSWTFGEFWARVECVAAGLALRLEIGSRAGLFMANRPEYMVLQFAIERAGLVRVPLNKRFTRHEVATILQDCTASAVFFDESTADRAEELTADFPKLWWCQVDRNEAQRGPNWSALESTADRISALPDIESLCSINYTSGSSGQPKGVMLTHRNWSALTRNMLIDRDVRKDDVLGHFGPLTHASGTYFLPWFLRGACNVIVEQTSIHGLLRAIADHRITVFTCVPTVLTRIVNDPQLQHFDLTSLRAIGYGAEPIPNNTLQKALKHFGPILTQNYGLTEAMMTVTVLDPADHFMRDEHGNPTMLRIGCIGRPYTFVEVVLRDRSGQPVPIGEVGELTIRSEHMTAGYWRRAEETIKSLRDGWLWSGDLARYDCDGFITLAGRSKEMLISGGFNIYPAEIEAVLTNHPQVVEAAVLGVPDADWGEVPVAFVAALPDSPISIADVRAHCRPLLGLKTPRRIALLEALPKNPNGKIDKPALMQRALETLDDIDARSR